MRGIILKGSLFSLSFVLSMVVACAAADVMTAQSPNMHTHSMMAAAAKPLPPATKKPPQTVEVPPMPKSSAAAPAAEKAEAAEVTVKNSAELEIIAKTNIQKPIAFLFIKFVIKNSQEIEALSKLTSLVGLKFMPFAKVNDAVIDGIRPVLPKLRQLSMPMSAVSDVGLKILGEDALGIAELDVGGLDTTISDEGVAALERLKLKRLNVSGSKVTNASLNVIGKFVDMTDLEVQRTFITKNEAEKLKLAMPGLKKLVTNK